MSKLWLDGMSNMKIDIPEEININLSDGYRWGLSSRMKAAELFLSYYKEFGDEHYRYAAESLMEMVAKDMNVDATQRAMMNHGGVG